MPRLKFAFFSAILLAVPLLLRGGIGADTAKALRSVELDPEECYRVRDLEFQRGDVHYFLTDGFLSFSKPVAGEPIAALFSTNDVEGGDGEVILLPPNKDERRELNTRTGAPNIDEHLSDAAFFFADDTVAELKKQMAANEWIHRDAARGNASADQYTRLLRNLMSQFETQLMLDLLNTPHQRGSYFAALLGGKTTGPFTVIFDPHASEQIVAGKPMDKGFQTWVSYIPKSLARQTPVTDFRSDHYRIDARIDAKLHMRVETTLTVSELNSELSVLAFDLSQQMRITSAEVDGQPVEIAETDRTVPQAEDTGDRVFLIVNGERLHTGSVHTVKVTHEGDVITAGQGGVYFVGSRGRWYPHRSLDFSRFELSFRFPKHFDLVAGGEVISDTTTGDERIMKLRSDVPLPMAGFNLGQYRKAVVRRGDFTIEVCMNRNSRSPSDFESDWPDFTKTDRRRTAIQMPAIPEGEERLNDLAAQIVDVMDFYSRRLGPPPLQKLVVSPIPGRFGQGFGGIIYLSTMAYMNPSGRALSDMEPQMRLFFTQLMLAHEAAHQWWGNLVITAGYHDEWIMEALANYCAMLYLEKRSGRKAVNQLMGAYRDALLATNGDGETVESSGPLAQGRRVDLEGAPTAWVAVMYGKGAWVMSMLHARMGDDNFWKMLGELRRRYERKSLSTPQFRELCAEFMPKENPDRKLETFFDQWVYGTGIPALKLTSSVKGAAKDLRVTGTLSQHDVPDDFSAWFPVEIQLRGKKVTKWVETSSDPVTFSATVPSAPLKVELDPGDRFLKR